MDKKNAYLNVTVAVISRFLVLIVTMISRVFLIRYLGTEANGIFALFTSIIGFLAVAELGIGTAITFSLYKPLVDKNYDKVSALFFLLKKIYLIISLIITVAGLLVMPFLTMLAQGETGTFNLHITYLIFLLGTIMTYFYAYKSAFIDANKYKYITIGIRAIGQILEAGMQIAVVIFTKSFELFFLSILISNVLQWFLTNIIFKKQFACEINGFKSIDDDTKKEVIQKTKAMFMHKIGGVLVITINGIIISVMINVVTLGYYSNYIMILTGVQSVLAILIGSLTAIIGHSFVQNEVKSVKEQFIKIYLLSFFLGLGAFLGFIAITDQLISILFGEALILDRGIVVALSINYFMLFLKQPVLLFRDASGSFYHDRYKPLLEGVVTISLSVFLVYQIGVIGVVIAAIVNNIVVCSVIEPFVLYKYSFKDKTRGFYLLNYSLMSLFVVIAFAFNYFIKDLIDYSIINILITGTISVGVTFVIFIIGCLVSKKLRIVVRNLLTSILMFIRKKRK